MKRQTVKGMLSAVIKESGTHSPAEVEAEKEVEEGRSIDVGERLHISIGAGAEAEGGMGMKTENQSKAISRSSSSNGSSCSSSSHGACAIGTSRRGQKDQILRGAKDRGREVEEEEEEEIEVAKYDYSDHCVDDDFIEEIDYEDEEEEEHSSSGSSSDDDDRDVGKQSRYCTEKKKKKEKTALTIKRKFPYDTTVQSLSVSSSGGVGGGVGGGGVGGTAVDKMTPGILLDLVLPRGLEYWTKDYNTSNTTAAVNSNGRERDCKEVKDEVENGGEEAIQGDAVTTLNSKHRDFHNSLLGSSLIDIEEV